MHVLVCFVPFLLVFKQPDLGTSIVYLVSWIAMMVAGGLPVIVLVLAAGAGGVLFPVLWGHLKTYQQSRILTFINPLIDPQGAGYNALQAMIAVGSGQLFGKGLGMGTQSHMRFCRNFIRTLFCNSYRGIRICRRISRIFSLCHPVVAYDCAIYARKSRTVICISLYDRFVYHDSYPSAHKRWYEHGNYPSDWYHIAICLLWGSSILAISLGFGILLSLRRQGFGDDRIAIV